MFIDRGASLRWVVALLALAGDAAFRAAPAGAQEAPTALSLERAVMLAADTAPQVTLAVLRTEEAQGRLRQARSVLFPDLTGSTSWARRTENLKSFGFSLPMAPGEPPLPDRIGPFNVFDFRGQVAQTVFDPSSWLQARAAHEAVTLSQAQSGVTAQTAAAQAGTAYVAVAQAVATLAARQADLRLAQDLVGLAQAQFDAGVGTRLDVVRAQTQEAQARAAIELARTQITQAQITLARALGLAPATRFALTDTLSPELARSAAPETHDAAVAMALERRPEIAAALAGVTAARLGGRALRAERLGRLQLAADYGGNGPAPNDMIATGELTVQYSIPFFQGFRISGQLQEQDAQLREAEVQLADVRQQVTAEVASALAAVASGLAQQTMARQQVALADEELREARLRYSNGIAGNIEVIDAQADVIRARNAMIAALAQTADARVRLARAVGVTGTLR